MEASRATSARNESPRAKRKRKALADLTNSVASSQSSCSSAVVKPRKPSSPSTVAPLLRATRQNTKLTVFAADCIDSRNSGNPISAYLSPPALGTSRAVNPERSSVYRRRRAVAPAETESRGKEITEPSSDSIPLLSKPDFGGKENKDGGTQFSKFRSVPREKQQKGHKVTTKDNTSKHCMPQDFIDEQRKYFAEIDAFSLSEEEVSADELE